MTRRASHHAAGGGVSEIIKDLTMESRVQVRIVARASRRVRSCGGQSNIRNRNSRARRRATTKFIQLQLEIPRANPYSLAMTASTLRVRRATVEDLDKLRPLWTSMHLPVAELEPRLTEFQVVEDAEGTNRGRDWISNWHESGQLHSEGYSDFGVADPARELLWTRIQTLATNHGILRLWTKEKTPFWDRLGFKVAGEQELKRLPVNWQTEGAQWFTLQLKDEAAINAVEQEMVMFMGAQKERADRMMQQMRTLKITGHDHRDNFRDLRMQRP